MAITQDSLIGWQAVEASGDLKILRTVLDNLGDEELMLALEEERKGRRDKYPVRAVWNTCVAGIVLGHATAAACLRELRRNAELRQVLGYDPMLGSEATPPDYVLSRLLAKLVKHQALLDAIFARLIAKIIELIPDFGARLAIDSKAIKSLMKSDGDAGFGVKKTTDADEVVVMNWYGYKIHCISDTATELPIAFTVTAPTTHDSKPLFPLLDQALKAHPELKERAGSIAADKAYDDGQVKLTLHQAYGLAPIIPSRDLQKGEYRALDEKHHDTIYFSPEGEIVCRHDPFNKEQAKQFCSMEFKGFEADRETLKFRCPAAAFGIECKNREACRSIIKDEGHGRIVRIKLEDNPRLFLPVHQGSRRFEKLYAERTSIERLFSRLDHMFGMEAPLRSKGLERATIRVTLAFSAMLATAVGWLMEERQDMIRSRLQTSAA